MSLHIATIEFFNNMNDEAKTMFSQGFYDTVDFDDRKNAVSWGSPWEHGYFDENINFMGNDAYHWGVQYAIQMKITNWFNLNDKRKERSGSQG